MKAGIIFIIMFMLSACSVYERSTASNFRVTPPLEKNSNDEYLEKIWKDEYEAASARLERNSKLWRESNIVNYDFVCEKPDPGGQTNTWQRAPVLIKVREGKKISIEMISKKDDYAEMYRRADGFEDIDTIDKLFAYLRKELDGGKPLNAEYDYEFGYPKYASLKYNLSSHPSRAIKISKFEAVK